MAASDSIELLHQLRQSPELLEELNTASGSELQVQQRLRQDYSPELVRAALALHEARRKAVGKLPEATQLWLTFVGLQQSTAWDVARHKAKRFPVGERVFDLCSGIGVDAAALADRGPVTCIDLSPAMLLRSEWNLQVWQKAGCLHSQSSVNFQTADVARMDLPDGLLHVDPDRRSGRTHAARRLEQYTPDLDWMQRTVRSGRSGALKIGPASNFMQKFAGCEIELISLHGECREATVWFGDLAGTHSFRATSLPSGESISLDPLDAWCPVADQPAAYLFDPDPAVVRSGLLDAVGEMGQMKRMDKEDEYLTGEAIPASAFVTSYFVEACLPNNLRSVKKHLQKSGSVDYEVKCRRLKVDANRIQKQLPRGSEPVRTVFFLKINGRSRVVIARRIDRAPLQTTPASG